MGTDRLVVLHEFCIHHEIEIAFVHLLHEYGLVELVLVEEIHFIPGEQVKIIERMIRLHTELGINLEGIDAVIHLLSKVDSLQQEIVSLKNRLRESGTENP